MPDHTRVQFGEFIFDTGSGELWRSGQSVPIERQPAMLLAKLVASPGALMTRDELASALWGDQTHVKFDDSLNYCVREIRIALEDNAKAPRFVATLPRRGYRFVAAVTPVTAARKVHVPRWAAVAATLAVAAIVLVESRPNSHHELVVAIARSIHDVLF